MNRLDFKIAVHTSLETNWHNFLNIAGLVLCLTAFFPDLLKKRPAAIDGIKNLIEFSSWNENYLMPHTKLKGRIRYISDVPYKIVYLCQP